MAPALRIGTRGSQLALAQTRWVAARLAQLGAGECEIVPVTTHGDVNRASLRELGGQGVFATELRAALLAGEVDIAVHSLKDLPSAPAPGLELAAFPVREDAADALVARDGLTLATLPARARVGTGSPRRRAQLLLARSDLDVRDIRGNIDTRIGYVTRGELDAVVLACAGLARLGRLDMVTQRLDPVAFPGAAGQGALGIEVRAGFAHPALAALDDAVTRVAVTAERAVLAGLGAGCQAPVAVAARVDGGVLRMIASVYAEPQPGERTAAAPSAEPQPCGQGACELRAEGSLPLVPASSGLAQPDSAETANPAELAAARLAAQLVADLFAQGADALIGP